MSGRYQVFWMLTPLIEHYRVVHRSTWDKTLFTPTIVRQKMLTMMIVMLWRWWLWCCCCFSTNDANCYTLPCNIMNLPRKHTDSMKRSYFHTRDWSCTWVQTSWIKVLVNWYCIMNRESRMNPVGDTLCFSSYCQPTTTSPAYYFSVPRSSYYLTQ